MTPVRCALIGFGAWGGHHARAIAKSPHTALAAIAARSEKNQAAVCEGAPLPASGGDGRWPVAMCRRAQESVNCGKPVAF